MGRATRWFLSLFGSRKKHNDQNTDNPRQKQRWSFKSGRQSFETAEMKWFRSVYSEAQNEHCKHAIAVAAATAAAAEAAVAAAEAAVAVVRLTTHGVSIPFRCLDERLNAAIKIQAFFRGFLAKKALKALKALVKLQALVRGYLVRKRAAATLHSMEALVRAQATIRAQKSKSLLPIIRLSEAFDDENKSLDYSPKIVEIDTGRPSLHCRCAITATSTPRFTHPSPSPNHRNYMSSTRAFEGKQRWQSAPKQRPEISRKRVPLGEVQSRASLSCAGVQRCCSQDESISFRSEGVMGKKIDGSPGFYLRRKW